MVDEDRLISGWLWLQVRLHVAGSGTTLDRTLRGLEMAAAPAGLKLPPGEHVERSYACALYSLIGKHRGALHVCREMLLFAGHENKYRTTVRSAPASTGIVANYCNFDSLAKGTKVARLLESDVMLVESSHSNDSGIGCDSSLLLNAGFSPV